MKCSYFQAAFLVQCICIITRGDAQFLSLIGWTASELSEVDANSCGSFDFCISTS